MMKTGWFTKLLAILGTVAIVLPVLAPIFFSVVFLFSEGRFLFDYLMPAELFPLVLVGSIFLIWSALRARSYHKLIIWSVVIGIIMLFGGQALAVATGLATGDMEPVGIWWALVLGSIIIFDLAVLSTGVGGILLVKTLFNPQQSGNP